MNLGITELLIVLVILVILFGAVKLPKLARSLGQSRMNRSPTTACGRQTDRVLGGLARGR
jgi:TatA/E family protein of Tat protein translocase